MPTVQISLVREHTAALQPPRALWVPFMLGRPLGAPDDATFQKRVMLAALRLLEREQGPILEDFPDDAPDSGEIGEDEAAACPVNFVTQRSDATLPEAVLDEIGQLQMWHELAVRRRGRTAVGVTQVPLTELVQFIDAKREGRDTASYRADLSAADALRLACEDLKSFYFEARAAQPGGHASTAIRDWFWQETAAARLLRELHAALENDDDLLVKDFARNYLIPRQARYGEPA
ncbi:MAG: hypothetical protein ACT4PS_05515 [Betaproteobacteria bacterium]